MCDSFCNPMECSLTRLLSPWNFPDKNTKLPFPSPGNLPKPEIKPRFPALASRFFTTEPPGKPLVTCGSPKRENNSDFNRIQEDFISLYP